MIDSSCAFYLCCTVVTTVEEFISVPPLLFSFCVTDEYSGRVFRKVKG